MKDKREAELRAAMEADASALVAIVRERWTPARDPLGEPMLLPATADEDPIRLDDFDWAQIRATFRERNGRAPQTGARRLARESLAG